jgi:hypothetical protein
MTESVGNETIEKYWCFLSRNWHCPDFLISDDIKNIFLYVGYVYAITEMNRRPREKLPPRPLSAEAEQSRRC